jgi:hypothetical protein
MNSQNQGERVMMPEAQIRCRSGEEAEWQSQLPSSLVKHGRENYDRLDIITRAVAELFLFKKVSLDKAFAARPCDPINRFNLGVRNRNT